VKKTFGLLVGILIIAIGVVSLAAVYPAQLEKLPNGFQIRAEQFIRFYVDYQQKQIVVPDVVLQNYCTPAKLRDCKTSKGVRYPNA
jgi:hypothetical protein